MNRFKALSLALLASGALATALPVSAYAGKAPKSGTHQTAATTVRLRGTVASWGTNTVTVTVKAGTTVTVMYNGQTRFLVNGQASTTAPTFTQNEAIVVSGVKNADGTVTARGIAVGARPAGTTVIRVGTVAAVGTGTLTIGGLKGKASHVVTLTGQTLYIVQHQATNTAPTFTTGQHVLVIASKNADGSWTARVVAVINAKQSAKVALKAAKAALKAGHR